MTLPAIYVTMEVEWMERAEKNKMTKYEVLKKYFGYDSFIREINGDTTRVIPGSRSAGI